MRLGSRGASLLVLATLVGGGGLVAVRDPVLRAAGRMLVVDERVGKADVIVLPQWSGTAGAIDAADLVRSGVAGRIAILPEPADPAEAELARRGVRSPDATGTLAGLLSHLGAEDVEVIPERAAGTEAEAQVLLAWFNRNQFRSIVVVSSPDHSRRVRRVFDRVLAGHPTTVVVHATRYSPFDPDAWWTTREGLRTEIVELQKLLLDYARHPLS